jgi:hypothetical protein
LNGQKNAGHRSRPNFSDNSITRYIHNANRVHPVDGRWQGFNAIASTVFLSDSHWLLQSFCLTFETIDLPGLLARHGTSFP